MREATLKKLQSVDLEAARLTPEYDCGYIGVLEVDHLLHVSSNEVCYNEDCVLIWICAQSRVSITWFCPRKTRKSILSSVLHPWQSTIYTFNAGSFGRKQSKLTAESCKRKDMWAGIWRARGWLETNFPDWCIAIQRCLVEKLEFFAHEFLHSPLKQCFRSDIVMLQCFQEEIIQLFKRFTLLDQRHFLPLTLFSLLFNGMDL